MSLFSKQYFDYEVNSKFFSVSWNENSNKITEKVFFSELDRLALLIQKYKPEKILGNIKNLEHLLIGEGVKKYLKIMVPAFKNAKLKKLGVVVGEDLFKQLFVENLFEKAMKIYKFEGAFFKTRVDALNWIEKQDP